MNRQIPPKRMIRYCAGLAFMNLAFTDPPDLDALIANKSIMPASAPATKTDSRPARLLVRYKSHVDLQSRDFKRAGHGPARLLKSFSSLRGLEVVEVAEDRLNETLRAFRDDPDVLYAEPDTALELYNTPNDPLFEGLWGLRNVGQSVEGVFCHLTSTPGADIRVTDAWKIWTGDPSFRIAVIDTGVNYQHPDLADNVWTNPNELTGDANGDGCPGQCGIDDDGDGLIDEDSARRQPGDPGYTGDLTFDDDENGWKDDIHGFDFFNNDPDPMDDNSHGSHVSGTIGAVGNNGLGVAGINWRCKIVGLKIFSASGSGGLVSDAVEALDYVITNRILVSNNSWGSGIRSEALHDAIRESQAIGHLFIAAAGNNFGNNNDAVPVFPAAFDLPNIVTVAASDNRDLPSRFSNRGRASVDLAAPGSCILSTVLGDDYGYKDGTSMATPHVTGAAALLMSRRPDLDWHDVKVRLLLTARPTGMFAGRTVTGGILDVAALIGDCNANGVPDEEEAADRLVPDCDRNGIPDTCESDCNANGRADSCDLFFESSTDCNADGLPDECGPDCNGDGIHDICGITNGTNANCNGNSLPDECELTSGAKEPPCGTACLEDCNGNGVPDECDIGSNNSLDCTRNSIPDECEPDCNGNNRADSCDIVDATSRDCSENGVPDECEPDCNKNGAPDSCDILADEQIDCDLSGIPDSCEPGGEIDCDGNGVNDVCDLRGGTHRDCNDNATPDLCDLETGTSTDENNNSVPDDCDGRGFALVPVSASGKFAIEDGELVLYGGGQTITLEVTVAGWDPDGDGAPKLRGYELNFPGGEFSSGERGRLTLAKIPCESNADCRTSSICASSGFCDIASSTFVDAERLDFALPELLPFRVVLETPSTGELRYIVVTWTEADVFADPGLPRYAATMILDVPQIAAGTFTVGFHPQRSRWALDTGEVRRPPTQVSARIHVLSDCNANGQVDHLDLSKGQSEDCNGNGIPDECLDIEADCNASGRPDACDITEGASLDCNANGVPDECVTLEQDCNDNGTPDSCDISGGTVADCNNNLAPDSCDLASGTSQDCNANKIPDDCRDLEPDCDTNNRPDDCDLAEDPDRDCNGNGRPDSCDLADGMSNDKDHDQIPDECRSILRVPSKYPSLNSAIEAARSGDHILLADGVYTGPDNSNLLFRGKVLTIRSENGPVNCILDGEHDGFGFLIGRSEPLSLIEGLTLRHFDAANGGAISCIRSTPTIHRCWFIQNHADGLGGAIACSQSSHAKITECVFALNTAVAGGGAVAADRQSNPIIRNCLFVNNSAEQTGGAFFLENLSLATIEHCTIVGNVANAGGGLFVGRAGLQVPGFSAPVIRNSILWDNRAKESTGHELAVSFGTQLFVEYSAVRGGTSLSFVDPFGTLRLGEGNLTASPQFREPAGPDDDPGTWQDNNYRLQVDSLLIDVGPPGSPAEPDAVDLDGQPRLRCKAVDFGAYEGGFSDVDCDGLTTLMDLTALLTCWSGPASLPRRGENNCGIFDLESDGDTDLRDLAYFQNQFQP